MTFKSKLIVATLVPAILTLVVAGFGIQGTKRTDNAMQEIKVNGTAIRNHVEGDMMHDGLRADVLAAILDASTNGGKNKDKILADTDEHGAWFKRVLAENEQLPLKSEIKKAIADAKPALDAYIASAHEVTALAFTDLESAKAKLTDFEASFTALEEKNEALSSVIEKANEDASKAAAPIAANAIRSLLFISILSILLGAVVMISINGQLQRGLRIVCSAAEMARAEITNSYLASLQSLAHGDLTFSPPSEVLPVQYQDRNEIGHFVQEFNGMLASLNESSHALGAAQESLAQMVSMIQTNSEAVAQTSAGIASHAEKNRTVAETLAASSQEAKAINTETVETMNGLRRSLDDVTADLEKQSDTVLETSTILSENADRLAAFVESTESMANSASDGRKALEDSNVAISRVEVQAKSASSQIQELEDSARQIGSIVTAIEDIAEQTNLLALNAAIEAARAGEQGRGFAVVADEVRKLAEQSRDATHKISGLVSSVLDLVERSVSAIELTYSEAQSGAESMKTTESALEELLERISGVTAEIHSIQTANTTMSGLMDKVVSISQESKESVSTHLEARCAELLTSIEAVAAFASQNAEQAEDVTYSADDVDRAVRDLAQMAQELQDASSRFRVGTEDWHDLGLAA